MYSIHIRTKVDSEGRIELRMPPQHFGQLLDLVVVYEPVEENRPVGSTSQPAGWPPGVFEATAGAWQGGELVREPQGEYEVRDLLT